MLSLALAKEVFAARRDTFFLVDRRHNEIAGAKSIESLAVNMTAAREWVKLATMREELRMIPLCDGEKAQLVCQLDSAGRVDLAVFGAVKNLFETVTIRDP